MAGSVNKVILVGNLGKDPEERNFQNGGKVVNLTLATSENWKDKATGEAREKTEWHNISILNERIGETAMRLLYKGAKVYIEGKISSRKYQDQAGQERWVTEVLLDPYHGEMTILSPKRQDDGSEGSQAGVAQEESQAREAPRAAARTTAQQARPATTARRRAPAMADTDDEIPF